MLKKFSIKNYKNFKSEIEIDFEKTASYQFSSDCITDGLIGKMMIYGRNATGKTNLGKALMNIYHTMFGVSSYPVERAFLNADSMEDAAVFTYIFQFGNSELIYKYARLYNQRLRDEQLYINGKMIFCCNFVKREFNFDNLNCIDAETAKKDSYLQMLNETNSFEIYNLPFLRWLINNVALKNESLLIQLSNYARKMMMVTVGNIMSFSKSRIDDVFYESLEIPKRLQDLEEFLNSMGVACKLA